MTDNKKPPFEENERGPRSSAVDQDQGHSNHGGYVCQSWALIGIGDNDFCIKGLPCRRWSCPECSRIRLRELCNLAIDGRPTSFITLTCKPSKFADPDEAARALVHSWRMIRQRLARDGIAKKIEFLAVFERTRKGWPHLHIVCRAPFIQQKYLSELADKYCGSPIVDIRQVKNVRLAAKYIAKYISKGPGKFEGTKRYWRSQGWVIATEDTRPVMDTGRDWSILRIAPSEAIKEFQNCGFRHEIDDLGGDIIVDEAGARWPWWRYEPFEKRRRK